MPIYEYRCADCGKTFDSIQKFSDAPFETCGQSTVKCPKDGKGKVERLLSSPSFHFKGSGFYITDYNKGSGGAKDTKSSTSSSSETKTESKPAASTESSTTTTKKDS
ncbi:MAG: zinc ribbon domain-containing protein [Acidobacteria bacterium]|nr:zinc ribbon domain-containing protein [Acidobacteriota bacterium]